MIPEAQGGNDQSRLEPAAFGPEPAFRWSDYLEEQDYLHPDPQLV